MTTSKVKKQWKKPAFKEITISMESTAYSATA
jgi:coenzyme PQQ precursor peptide PqqA